jgi:hypothetical protein
VLQRLCEAPEIMIKKKIGGKGKPYKDGKEYFCIVRGSFANHQGIAGATILEIFESDRTKKIPNFQPNTKIRIRNQYSDVFHDWVWFLFGLDLAKVNQLKYLKLI